MNIADAKQQIKNAMTAYFTRDEFGNYVIPLEKQRPVLLIGPPGIGKTAVMEQIASELGVGLVSYSMTHHTRQSALGLPYITTQEFEGKKYQVSEYTMSEIIASVYSMMRETGVREGILFLDEINCVSETLAPCMLQFLQYKVFGQHRIPEGWIVVTAGNPPEYNKSVRDFDIVTWDRLKRIDVEPDYEAWKRYASLRGIHPAVTTYLSARQKDFYKVESTVDGKNFVTARGWDDLSEMIRLYEQNGIAVDEKLIGQYLQDRRIAKDFAVYYDLFSKYRSDYRIESVLEGNPGDDVLLRAQNAQLDERLSFLGLLFDAVTHRLRGVCEEEDMLDRLTPHLKEVVAEAQAQDCRTGRRNILDTDDVMEGFMGKAPGMISVQPSETASLVYPPELVADLLRGSAEEEQELLEKGQAASSMTPSARQCSRRVTAALEDIRADILREGASMDTERSLELVRAGLRKRVERLKEDAADGQRALENAFTFCEKAFQDGDEILIFVTELTVNYHTARFIGHYGCEKYYMHNKQLQFAERQAELDRKVGALSWEV